MNFAAIVMGGSAGSFSGFNAILSSLPANFPVPLLIAQHLYVEDDGLFAGHLARVTLLPVSEANDKLSIKAGHIYVAPANYHLLVEDEKTLALSIDAPVNFSRPSIDVLFESAARVWGESLVAILLSGANSDGTIGMNAVKACGGYNIAQDPATAENPVMPRSAIEAGAVDEILSPLQIASRLKKWCS